MAEETTAQNTHGREKSRRMRELSRGCRKPGADRLRGQEDAWGRLPGTGLGRQHWSDRLDRLLPLFPIKWYQAVETVDLSLECRVWALGQKKAG